LRRKYTKEFKLQCCRQVATGQKRPAQLCREHSLAESVRLRWRKEYEARGEAAFTEKQPSSREEALEARIAEQRRRAAERTAKLRHSQEEKAEGEERRARDAARRSWKANGGTEAAFDQAWPSMWEEMLKRRTVGIDREALQAMTRSSVSRI
jgi:transposase